MRKIQASIERGDCTYGDQAHEKTQVFAVEDQVGDIARNPAAKQCLAPSRPNALDRDEQERKAKEPSRVNHLYPPETGAGSVGSPAACHSGNPAVRRRALNP